MNFTWFASAYDTDDVALPAARRSCRWPACWSSRPGCPRAFEDHDFAVIAVGYVVMRLAMVAQWLRAPRSSDPERRAGRAAVRRRHRGRPGRLGRAGWRCPRRSASPAFVVLVVARAGACPSGPSAARPHAVAPATTSPSATGCSRSSCSASHPRGDPGHLGAPSTATDCAPSCVLLIVGSLILFSMWWIYFKRPMVDSLRRGDVVPVRVRARLRVRRPWRPWSACLAVLVDIIQEEVAPGDPGPR